MFLQERIEELGSGILTIIDSKVELVGFTCPERLYEYLNDNVQCFFSKGFYNFEDLNFSYIQNSALFLIYDKDNNLIDKYCYELLKKDTIKYKDENKRLSTKVYYLRKCKYTGKYNYKDLEVSITFDTKENLLNYFKDRFCMEVVF